MHPASEALKEAVSRLKKIPAGADARLILDAISSAIGCEAAMLSAFSADSPHAMSARPLGLPSELLHGWLSTTPEYFTSALVPVVQLPEGAFWCQSDTVMRTSRGGLQVLNDLDSHGLGQGAGYKLTERRTPDGGVDYTFLALMTARGRLFSPQAGVLLNVLQPHLQQAIERLSLPLIPTIPILRQIVEDNQQGYIALSTSFHVVELNRRAHDIAMLYRTELGLTRDKYIINDLTERLAGGTAKGRVIMRGDGLEMLDIKAHRLKKEAHSIPEDIILITLRTIEIPAQELSLPDRPRFRLLTPAQRRVADLLLDSGFSRKEIASEMGISEGTVRTHMQKLYRRLGVRSRAELAMLGRSVGAR